MTKLRDLITRTELGEGWGGFMEYEYTYYDGTGTDRYTYDLFEEFMKKNPRLRDAEIVGKGRVFGRYPFRHRYRLVDFDEMWKVVLNGKLSYAVGISRPWRGYNPEPSMIHRRFYEEGETRIRRNIRKVELNRVNHGQGKKTFKRDCQIRTLATVTDQDYFDIHRELAERGWSEKNAGNVTHTRGHKKNRWDEVLEVYGLKKEVVWKRKEKVWVSSQNEYVRMGTSKILNHKSGMTVATAVRELPKGTYIATVSGHVCAIVDNKLFDSWNCQNKRVETIWEVKSIKS